jgi:hypothetical protein
MRREPLKYSLFTIIGAMIVIELFLLISGNRVLLDEEYYPEHDTSGGTFYVEAEEAKFGCTYFTGRRRIYETLSSYQYDECPFVWTQG